MVLLAAMVIGKGRGRFGENRVLGWSGQKNRGGVKLEGKHGFFFNKLLLGYGQTKNKME